MSGGEKVNGLAKLLFGASVPPVALGRGRIKTKVTNRPSPSVGSKRKASQGGCASGSGSSNKPRASGVSASSSTPSTPAAERIDVDSEAAKPSSTAGIGSDGSDRSGAQAQPAQGQGNDGGEAEDVIVLDEDLPPCAKRRKRRTSIVWQYFEKKIVEIEVNGQKYEQLWGYCKFPNCRTSYRAESGKGTSGFLNHLRTAHNIVKGQMQLSLAKDHTKSTVVVEPYRYDQEVSLRKLYLAIIMHEYPFNIVEHEYFVEFIKSLRPSFPIKSRITTRKDIMDIYLEEKDKLYDCFKNVKCRFSATMDMWTSCQNKSYMAVTLHWVDDDWKIQKRIVGFFHVEGSHTGQKLSETFTELLVKWYVEKKLFALTLDNASANEVAVNDIIKDLNENHGSLICEGLFFHVRCACHILNLVARDGLAVIAGTIEKIKKLVLTVKGSPLQFEELMKRAGECGLDKSKGLSLDVSTRWNSTYLMLRDALYYKPAFMRLKSSDRRKYEKITPSPEEWSMALKLFQCLKKFFDLTEILSGTSYPTANMFYRGFCDIKELIDKWCVNEDFVISKMAASMSEKFEKYWNKSCTVLAVACFLDPRYKKRLIEYYMMKFYAELGKDKVDDFLGVMKSLYRGYASSAPAPSKENVAAPESFNTDDLLMETQDDELDRFLYDTNASDMSDLSELEKYMAAPLLKHNGGQFDILVWWKDHSREYPILSQIARDVLAVQVSTVASESAFSAGGRVIDPYRSRLDPEMVQALICTKDWIAAARKDSKHITSLVGDLDILEDFAEYLKPENDDFDEDYDDDEDEIEEEKDASDPDDMNDEEQLFHGSGP